MDWEAQAVLDWASQHQVCAVDCIPNDVWELLRTGNMPGWYDYASLRFCNGQAKGFVRERYADDLDLCRGLKIETVILYEDLIAQSASEVGPIVVDLEEVL